MRKRTYLHANSRLLNLELDRKSEEVKTGKLEFKISQLTKGLPMEM